VVYIPTCLVEQEPLTLQEHPSSPPVLVGFVVLDLQCVCFIDRCLSCCPFSCGHCVVCSSIYGFWLDLWYLKTILTFIDVISDRQNSMKLDLFFIQQLLLWSTFPHVAVLSFEVRLSHNILPLISHPTPKDILPSKKNQQHKH